MFDCWYIQSNRILLISQQTIGKITQHLGNSAGNHIHYHHHITFENSLNHIVTIRYNSININPIQNEHPIHNIQHTQSNTIKYANNINCADIISQNNDIVSTNIIDNAIQSVVESSATAVSQVKKWKDNYNNLQT